MYIAMRWRFNSIYIWIPQARNTYDLVSKHRRPNEAVIVAGDFNCHHHALRELTGRYIDNIPRLASAAENEGAGDKSKEEQLANRMQMSDCFEDLGSSQSF